MMAEIVVAGVSPGMRIISSPTEQTAVMASSFSRERCPCAAASASVESSETGMNAPLRPPTELDAKSPPFLTASLSMAIAAVEPGAPTCAMPSVLRISPILSPIVGVGARDRSTTPNCVPIRSATSRPISSPMRVTRKLAVLISSDSSERVSFLPLFCADAIRRRSALSTTPGPETPILTVASGSPAPMYAPAMNGLSSGIFAKTTSFAAANPVFSLSAFAMSRMT